MWTQQQKAFSVATYLKTGSLVETRKEYLCRFNINRRRTNKDPNKSQVMRWTKKFLESGTVMDKNRAGRPKSVSTAENVQVLKDSIEQSQERSVRHHSQVFNISRQSLWRMLWKVGFKPYHLTIHRALTPSHMKQRTQKAEWLLGNSHVLGCLWFSDEAHFYLCGYVNSCNAVHCGLERADTILTKPLYSTKLIMWSAMRKGQKPIEPFFEDDNQATVTVNSETYVKMTLKSFCRIIGKQRGIERDTECFQQDDASAHTSRDSLEWLQQHFPGRHVSYKIAIPWAPHSPDLTPHDYMLWGYLKSKVYISTNRTAFKISRQLSRTRCRESQLPWSTPQLRTFRRADYQL